MCTKDIHKTLLYPLYASRCLKFAEYVHNYKSLPGNIFDLIHKNKMASTGKTGVSLTVIKDFAHTVVGYHIRKFDSCFFYKYADI